MVIIRVCLVVFWLCCFLSNVSEFDILMWLMIYLFLDMDGYVENVMNRGWFILIMEFGLWIGVFFFSFIVEYLFWKYGIFIMIFIFIFGVII